MSDLVKRGHDQVAELKSSCGAVDVRDVAQLISDLATQLDVQLARSNALAAENAGMSAFVDALLSIAWQGCSADGADIEELALKHGLLRQEVYSADEHETLVDDPGNFEDGNPVYFRVETQATDDFLAEVRAAAVDEVCLKISNAIINCYQDEQIGLDAAATICGDFAAQLRKGEAS
ncbi:TPA: hypothetical protein LU086_000091 [Enterobacter hormaechei subsp. xiangfangensis]|uniref:hypothetical protein n=1 Tax=Enterobacter hormaechei TaxID=158836 RepID=UPI000697E5D5|nr:hypothetical protein [Enterobacter hormaechei]HBM2727886.1 hypothetical protein [Enterobacter hormaechei subsp. xiangfangensis]HBM2739229.1 hypothetical protein [Enterobacter hormaechei subsp. xiangfangensis]HBM2742471.1 hypothetical protein [Enterobacter hormaechei subsp. xiangfangensis]HBM2747789.1 hypothetical protein [Enterobacter hormaechei subsp. xiangfangensis]HBM2757367.1 hypothetical protein [Enterobacter hormaechei subsp. xiangfangensis]